MMPLSQLALKMLLHSRATLQQSLSLQPRGYHLVPVELKLKHHFGLPCMILI